MEVAVVVFVLLGAYLWWDRSNLYVAAAHRSFRRGDEAQTLVHFAKAEAAGRLGAEVTASYAYLLMKHDRAEDAQALLVKSLRQGRRGRALKEPARRLLTTYQALAYRQLGDLDQAVAVLDDLYATGYRTMALYGNLGFFLIEQKAWDRAEIVCAEAAEWAPDGKVILDNLGTLHLERGRVNEAVAVYDRLLALEPKFPEAWWGAGRAALLAGDKALARQRWEHALTLPFNALTTVPRADIEAALASEPVL